MTAPVPFPRIVVPLDGSPASETAIGPAVELAGRWALPITLIRVVTSEASRATAVDYLREVADRRARGLVDQFLVRRVAEESEVAAELVSDAAFDGALLCMATHGRSGSEQLRLGSVAAEALRISARPILLVGPAADERRPIGDGAVVACLDGSMFAESILPAATAWARMLEVPLALVEVDVTGRPRDHDPPSYLGAVAATATSGASWQVIRGTAAADELVTLARRRPIGLLAMTTHGRTGHRQRTLGSVAMDAIRRAPCPVLVVRSRAFDDAEPAAPSASNRVLAPAG